jgi:hypothetical protein
MENKRDEILEKLVSFYKSIPGSNGKNFFDDLLHESCGNAEVCWKQYDNEAKKAPWNYFSLPFIGKKYEGDLVCVGINVHKGGGSNLQEMQIRGINVFKTDKEPHKNDIYGYKYDPGVIESFINGSASQKHESLLKKYKLENPKRKHFIKIDFKKGMQKAVDIGDLEKPKKGKKPYDGTELWHRIAAYSAILLGFSSDVADDFKKLAEIYEHIIFMDAVKCSPATPDSKFKKGPLEKLCIKNIFFKELEIIRPKNILIMNHLAAELIRKNNKEYKYIEGSKDFPGSGRLYDYCKLEINNESVNVYYVRHPSARLVTRDGLFEGFVNFIESKK